MEIGLFITAFVWILVFLATVFGGLFLRKITGGEVGVKYVAKKTAKTVFAWAFNVKVGVVIALVILGILFLALAPRGMVLMMPTGKAYRLIENVEYQGVPDVRCHVVKNPNTGEIGTECVTDTHYVKVYRYTLIGRTIYSYMPLRWLDPGFVLLGMAFICAALILTAIWMVRANNDWADRYVWGTKE